MFEVHTIDRFSKTVFISLGSIWAVSLIWCTEPGLQV